MFFSARWSSLFVINVSSKPCQKPLYNQTPLRFSLDLKANAQRKKASAGIKDSLLQSHENFIDNAEIAVLCHDLLLQRIIRLNLVR